jgi:integrase/recombinase XerD
MPKRREGPRRDKKTDFYYFDEYVGLGDDKKRIRFSLKTRDPDKARWRWEQEYRKHWSKYYGIESPATISRISFADLANEFVDYQRKVKKIKEWETVRNRLRIIHEIWGEITLDKIDKDKLIELDEHLRSLPISEEKKGRSEATINHYFSLLKTFFNYAIREKYLIKNPVSDIRPYTVDEKRREYTPEELERILDATDRIEKEARNSAVLQKYAKRIILLLLYTGMRIGEVLNLRCENIQEDKIVTRRTETKQKKEKVIPLTDPLREILDQFQGNGKKDKYVIPLRRRSGIMRAAWADSLIKKIREYSGVEDFIFHNIRHTASTIMVSEALGKGVGLADVMKILGHSQVETTMRYLHADFGRMKKAMEALERKAKKKD